MHVHETDSYGSPALRIETEAGIWTHELDAGGFSSLIDPSGDEWIGFAPGDPGVRGGAGNVFRGIPNLVYPDNIGHPGYRHSSSEWESTPERVAIRTRSGDGLWGWTWTVSESSARLVVDAAPSDRRYWFLYEGTPGGRFDLQTATWGTTPGGTRPERPRIESPLEEAWSSAWFGDSTSRYVLWITHETASGEPSFMSWMSADPNDDDGMVVFGFGRTHEDGPQSHLQGSHSFTVRLADSQD